MFEDTKGAIRIRISKKNRQHNGQMNMDKMTNNYQQNTLLKGAYEYYIGDKSLINRE